MRCGQPYDAFPFRKCIAVQSIVRHLDAAAGKRRYEIQAPKHKEMHVEPGRLWSSL